MANRFNPDIITDKTHITKLIDHESEYELTKLQQGKLGLLWGSSSNVPNNIAALLATLSFLTGLVYTVYAANIPSNQLALSILNFWSIMTPIITLSVGYLFGNKNKKDN